MEMLTVNNDGAILIPPEIIKRFGLRPGDQTAVMQTTESLLICDPGLAEMEEWWNSLSEEEKIEARKEAEWYESLSEEERDAIWNEGAAELEEWLEGADDDDDNGDHKGVLSGTSSQQNST